MSSSGETRWRAIPLVVILLVVVALGSYRERVAIEKGFEDVMLAVAPSAGRAYAYGNKHFDARLSEQYDVDRAYALFIRARDLDPKYPAVYHQIGRIEFLKGNLNESLALLNQEFATNPDPSPSSYYVRALIKGYLKDYLGAAADYEAYFKATSANWGAINDYAWVLMQANLHEGALAALDWGLSKWPENAWLLNNRAIALYEVKRFKEAYESALKAREAIAKLTEDDWHTAYPGNDPKAAATGLASFKLAAEENFEKIRVAAQK